MTTTILVSGASGNIGREILAALAANSEARVLAGARDPRRAAEQLRHLPGVRAVELDLDRPETVAAALTGVDKLAVVNAMTPGMAQQTSVLVAAARQAGVGHIVRSSLMGVDEPNPIVEAVWHGEADAAVRESGIPFTILRPTQYFQNWLNFGNLDSVRDQGVLYLPLGQSRVSSIDTRDIGACAARVLLTPGAEHHGRAYVLTGGESAAMDEVVQAMSQALGKPVRYVPVEEAQYRQGMLGAGMPELIADAILGWFAYCRAGRANRVEPGVERLLGRKPIGLREFVRDHADRWR
jgi:uncharacterized protein YbjT (DUF2867 family)